MNSKINKGRIQFNDENYEEALNYFNAVDESDEDYDYVLIFKITCLMELERFDKALFLIDSLLDEDPTDELMMYEKIRCHVALDEKSEALNALKKFERIFPKDNKRMILDVAIFYKTLGEFKKALTFCNMALSIDSDFEEAIYEKSLIGIALDNDDIINNCANKLLDLIDDDQSKIIPIFLLKIYSGRFKDCMGIIKNLESQFDEETCEMLKAIVFNQLCENFGVNIHLTDDVELSVGEAIELLFNYHDDGVNYGVINGVGFVIM